MGSYIFTSESVTEGHPDKIADQISDAILDALLAQDPRSRVACETLINTGYVNVAGEITTKAVVNYPEIIRKTIREIGYDSSEKGFDADTCGIMVSLDAQSDDIAMGVDEGRGDHAEQGAVTRALCLDMHVMRRRNLCRCPSCCLVDRPISAVRKNSTVLTFARMVRARSLLNM